MAPLSPGFLFLGTQDPNHYAARRSGATAATLSFAVTVLVGLLRGLHDQPRHALNARSYLPSLCHAPQAHGPHHISQGSVQALNCLGAHTGHATIEVSRRWSPNCSFTSFRCLSVRCRTKAPPFQLGRLQLYPTI